MPMDVAFFDDAREFGGHEVMAVAGAAGTALNSGGAVRFYVWEGNERLIAALEVERSAGAPIEIQPMPVHAHKAQGLRSLLFREGAAKVRRLLGKRRPTLLVAVQGRIELGSVLHQAASDLGIPSVSYLPMAHTHREMGSADAFGLKDFVSRQLYLLPDAYITVSKSIADQIGQFAPSVRCAIVENFVDADPAPPSRSEARARLGLREDEKVVALIGRVQFSQKGHDLVVAALKLRPPPLEKVRFLVVGDGPDLERLKAMVRESGLEAQFTFLGWKKNDMVAIYSALDVLLVPSLFESGPLVMLEALVYGKRVVGSDRIAMTDWLPRENRFDPHAPEEIVAVLTRVLSLAANAADEAYIAYAKSHIHDKQAFGRKFCQTIKEYSDEFSSRT